MKNKQRKRIAAQLLTASKENKTIVEQYQQYRNYQQELESRLFVKDFTDRLMNEKFPNQKK